MRKHGKIQPGSRRQCHTGSNRRTSPLSTPGVPSPERILPHSGVGYASDQDSPLISRGNPGTIIARSHPSYSGGCARGSTPEGIRLRLGTTQKCWTRFSTHRLQRRCSHLQRRCSGQWAVGMGSTNLKRQLASPSVGRGGGPCGSYCRRAASFIPVANAGARC
jgi:hypothetical protein